MKTKMLGILAVLLIVLNVSVFAQDVQGKWEETAGAGAAKIYKYTFSTVTHTVTCMVIVENQALRILAFDNHEDEGVVFEQFITIGEDGGKGDHRFVIRYPGYPIYWTNWYNCWYNHWTNRESSSYDIFAAKCANAAKTLPAEVKKRFYGYYGLK